MDVQADGQTPVQQYASDLLIPGHKNGGNRIFFFSYDVLESFLYLSQFYVCRKHNKRKQPTHCCLLA